MSEDCFFLQRQLLAIQRVAAGMHDAEEESVRRASGEPMSDAARIHKIASLALEQFPPIVPPAESHTAFVEVTPEMLARMFHLEGKAVSVWMKELPGRPFVIYFAGDERLPLVNGEAAGQVDLQYADQVIQRLEGAIPVEDWPESGEP